MKLDLLHARSGRRCSTPGCSRIPEPKDELCIVCQLLGATADSVEVSESSDAGLEIVALSPNPSPPDVAPWQVRVGRDGALTGRVPLVKGRLVQAWGPGLVTDLSELV